jgi:predicted PurR-regulated permease PerM
MPTLHRDAVPTARWLALLAVTAAAVYLCWLIVLPFVDVLLWATVMAVVVHPVHRWLLRRGHGPNAAAGLTTVGAVLVVLVPTFLLGLVLVQEAKGLGDAVRYAADTITDPNWRVYQYLGKYVDLSKFRDSTNLTERANQIVSAVAERSTGFLGGVAGVVIKAFFVVFTLFYLLRDADSVLAAVRRFLPVDPAQADALIARGREVTYASVAGVVFVAAIQAALGGVMMAPLGVPSPVLWTMVMFLAAMIPVGGATLVWIPAALWLAGQGHWGKAIVLAAWGALVVGMADNILRPRIVGRRTRLHELVVFFSVLGGLQVFGVLGLFVGPAVVATTALLIDAYRLSTPGVEAAAALASPAAAAVVPAEVAAGTVLLQTGTDTLVGTPPLDLSPVGDAGGPVPLK